MSQPGEGPKCPICGKPAGADLRPFCSRRCADVDLGRWLKGGYAIPGAPAGPQAPGGPIQNPHDAD
ncbi:MAG: DNA gyrase inhibitor YacG [Alphaproteobacteria bacterium]|nr:DNA gyrase inhibitor YacG [Alphaproteobacteria bacterium]